MSPDTTRDPSRLSKFLALVLRHRAFQFGLDPDDEGFVPFEDLLRVIREESRLTWAERADVEAIAAANGRKRFEIRGDSIRATYGHSFARAILYPKADPPDELYAGLTRGQVEVARLQGLKPEGRQYLHLTEERQEAEDLAKRKDPEAVVVTVRAREAAEAGIPFHRPTDGIYLSGPIGADFLDLALKFGRRQRRTKSRR